MNYLMEDHSHQASGNTDHHEVRLEVKPVETLDTEMAMPFMLGQHVNGSSTTKFECPVCYEEKWLNEGFDQLPCAHHFCIPCLSDYLKSKIDDNKIIEIKCPNEGCTQILSEQIIQKILDPKTFENYKSHKDIKLLARNPNIRYCPNPLCSKPFVPNKQTEFTTCDCGTQICNACVQYRHEGKPCSTNPNENLAALLQDHDIRHCIICKTPAEKNGGCPIMVCPICDYHWCWRCGRHYEIGHEFACKRVWNPIHPNDEAKGCGAKTKKGCIKALGIVAHVLSSILMPFVAILFWPLMTIFAKKISRKKPCQFLLILLANFALAAITSPITIVLVVGMVIWHFIKYQSPWLLYCFTCKCCNDSDMYRWKRADAAKGNFEYQEKHNFPHAIALG